MQLEEMKELYKTGEWIAVTDNGGKWRKAPSANSLIMWEVNHVLIHKKHADVLDHVLNGGNVNASKGDGFVTCYNNEFIEGYNHEYEYRIIKGKPDLNGNYCLATKEHYDKLVEDGCIDQTKKFYLDHRGCLCVFDNHIYLNKYHEDYGYKPMHLNNGEWIFGSLEHEKTFKEIEEEIYSRPVKTGYLENDPITKEDISCEVHRVLSNYNLSMENLDEATDLLVNTFTEYLKANQKDNT